MCFWAEKYYSVSVCVLYSVFIMLQNIFCNMASSETATLSRKCKRSLVPQIKYSFKELIFISQSDFPSWLSSFAHMWHLMLQIQLPNCPLSALAHSVNRHSCCCLVFSVHIPLLLSVWGWGFLFCPFLILLMFFSCWIFCSFALISLEMLLLLLRN